MPRNQTSFSRTHQPPRESKRRILSESLISAALKDHGDDVLQFLAKIVKEPEHRGMTISINERIKAADRFLCHSLLQPRVDSEEAASSSGIDVFVRAGMTLEQAREANEKLQKILPSVIENIAEEIGKKEKS